MSAYRILLVWDRLGDYHRIRVKHLAIHGKVAEVFTADLGAADGLYQWQSSESPNHFQLSKLPVEQADSKNRLEAYKTIVKQQNINIIGIAGYGRVEYRDMMRFAKRNNIKVIMFAESWYPKNKVADFIKGRWISRLADRYLVSGIKAEKHFVGNLKISEKKIRSAYSVVDNQHFECEAPLNERQKVLLCIARLSPEKNLLRLISAFKKSELRHSYTLRIIGSGPLKAEVGQALESGIELKDWASYNELPVLYASSSAFILPSTFEPWGLVVNEAMAAGLPVLVSEESGCAPDLAKPTNSIVFTGHDESSIVDALNKFSAKSDTELAAMGRHSSEIIKSYSPEVWAKNFVFLIEN